jgi:ferrochelatase
VNRDPAAPDLPGVLLVNLGTPDAPTASALRRYLREFLWDPRIVDVPRPLWWLILNLFVLTFRPRKSARLYARIWGSAGSPLLTNSRALADGVRNLISQRTGHEMPLTLGMRYGNPSLGEALTELRQRGSRRILLMPLYPQYSATTTASTWDGLATVLRRQPDHPALRTVRSYPEDPTYLDALASSVQAFWREHGRGDHLVLSFHGLPQRYVDAGDPYPDECRATTAGLVQRLGLDASDWTLSYQSRFGPGAWLMPSTEDRLAELGGQGIERVDAICPGFAADCLETLEEIAISGAETFEAAGGGALRYIPALNASPDHVATITNLILRELRGWID